MLEMSVRIAAAASEVGASGVRAELSMLSAATTLAALLLLAVLEGEAPVLPGGETAFATAGLAAEIGMDVVGVGVGVRALGLRAHVSGGSCRASPEAGIGAGPGPEMAWCDECREGWCIVRALRRASVPLAGVRLMMGTLTVLSVGTAIDCAAGCVAAAGTAAVEANAVPVAPSWPSPKPALANVCCWDVSSGVGDAPGKNATRLSLGGSTLVYARERPTIVAAVEGLISLAVATSTTRIACARRRSTACARAAAASEPSPLTPTLAEDEVVVVDELLLEMDQKGTIVPFWMTGRPLFDSSRECRRTSPVFPLPPSWVAAEDVVGGRASSKIVSSSFHTVVPCVDENRDERERRKVPMLADDARECEKNDDEWPSSVSSSSSSPPPTPPGVELEGDLKAWNALSCEFERVCMRECDIVVLGEAAAASAAAVVAATPRRLRSRMKSASVDVVTCDVTPPPPAAATVAAADTGTLTTPPPPPPPPPPAEIEDPQRGLAATDDDACLRRSSAAWNANVRMRRVAGESGPEKMAARGEGESNESSKFAYGISWNDERRSHEGDGRRMCIRFGLGVCCILRKLSFCGPYAAAAAAPAAVK